MLPHDQLEPLHPFFKQSIVQVCWNGMVQKVEKGNSVFPRLLVLASPGLFFFEKGLLVGYKLIQVISFSEMHSLKYEEGKIIITSTNKRAEFSSNANEKIISMILGIQSSLFNPMVYDIPEDVKDAINDDLYIFETRTPLCERYLSLALQFADNVDPQLILNEIPSLLDTKYTFKFTSEMVSGPCIDPIINAVCLDTDITDIVFSSINFHEFVDHLREVISLNNHIKSITFHGILFVGDSSELVRFFKTKVASPITSINFIQCDLSTNRFTNFLLAFSTFKCQITSIKVKDCTFSSETIRALFVCLFQSPCFTSLQEFNISGDLLPPTAQELVSELLDPNQSNFPSCFKHLRISSANLDAKTIISQFVTHKNHVKTLDVSRCNFKSRMPTGLTCFSRLTEIDISDTWLTPDSLFSLFQSVNQARIPLATLIADHVHMSEQNFNQFYQNFSLECPSIRRLSWEMNAIKDDSIISGFIHFLSRLKNVIDLSISHVIVASPKSAELIKNYLDGVHIHRFVMRGYDKTAFQDDFVPILEALLQHDSLVSLDVTGQGFGDVGIEILGKMMNNGLQNLLWDEQRPVSPELTIEILLQTVSDQMQFSLWPEENIKALWAKMPISRRSELQVTVEQIKQEFIEKYSRIVHNCLGTKNSFFEKSRLPRVKTIFGQDDFKEPKKVDFEILTKIPEKAYEVLNEIRGSVREDYLTTQTRNMVCKFLYGQIC